MHRPLDDRAQLRIRLEAEAVIGILTAFDALHLACAEAGSVDYFCSCDDRLLKKAKLQSDLKMKTMSPLDLVEELAL